MERSVWVWSVVVLAGASGLGIAGGMLSGHTGGIPAGAPPAGSSAEVRALASARASIGHTAWTEVNTSTQPSNRDQVQMAYDPMIGEVVLFGGYAPTIHADGDTWEFHAGIWTNVTSTFTVAPPARWAAGFAYDPAVHGLVLFGGRNTTTFFNDTWIFTGSAWHQPGGRAAPSERSGVAMTYDVLDKELVLFGGGKGNVPVGSGSAWSFYNDTWTFGRGGWSNITSRAGAAPTARFGMTAVYDPSISATVFEGGSRLGSGGAGVLQNDTYYFVYGAWTTPLALTGAPPPLYGEAAAYDPQLQSEVVVGENQTSGFDPVWALHGGSWLNASPLRGPSPATRGNFGLAYDIADRYLVLFGGDTVPPSYAYRSDTWTFA